MNNEQKSEIDYKYLLGFPNAENRRPGRPLHYNTAIPVAIERSEIATDFTPSPPGEGDGG